MGGGAVQSHGAQGLEGGQAGAALPLGPLGEGRTEGCMAR